MGFLSTLCISLLGAILPCLPTGLTLQRYYVHGSTYIDERAILHDSVNDEEYYYALRELYTVEARGTKGEITRFSRGETTITSDVPFSSPNHRCMQ